MKIRKFFASVIAVLMILAMVTGCSKDSGETSADTVKGIESTLTYKHKDSYGISDIKFTSDASGRDSAFSVKGSVKVEGKSYAADSDKLIVVSDNKLYVNVKSLLEFLSGYGDDFGISGSDIDAVKGYIKEDYVYVDFESMKDYLNEADSESVVGIINDLMDAFNDIAEVNDTGTLKMCTITCKSAEDFVKVAEVLKKYVADNKSTWTDDIYERYGRIDINDVVDNVADMIVSAMGYDESMSEMLKKQMLADIDTSDYEVSRDAIAELFNRIEAMFDIDTSDIEDFNGDVCLKITSSGNRTYGVSVEVNGPDSEYTYISYSFFKELFVDVSAPDKAQNISDTISDLVKNFAETE